MSSLSDFTNNGLIFHERFLLLSGERKHFKFHDLDIQIETCLHLCAYIGRREHPYALHNYTICPDILILHANNSPSKLWLNSNEGVIREEGC